MAVTSPKNISLATVVPSPKTEDVTLPKNLTDPVTLAKSLAAWVGGRFLKTLK